MKQHLCPYLGSREDPTTALDFPSEGNFCYHARPVAAINQAHQSAFCLTTQHSECPVFQAQQLRPLPAAIAAPSPRSHRFRRALFFALIPLVLLIFAVAASWVNRAVVTSQYTGGPATNFVFPGSGLFTQTVLPTNTPYQPRGRTTTVMPSPTLALIKDCPLPAGWQPYQAQPSDSLFRLSVLYRLPIETLQQANCLAGLAVIQPGDIVYVPIPPTPTPTITRTATIAPPTPNREEPTLPQPLIIPTNTQKPTQAPTATPIIPTLPRSTPTPTNPPPTSVVPTLAPTDTPPPPPPPTPTIAAPSATPRLPTPTKEPKLTHTPKPTKTPDNTATPSATPQINEPPPTLQPSPTV